MRWRYLLWLALPGLLVLVFMWSNPHVSNLYHHRRVQPFILMDIAKILMVVLLIIQHPGPARGIPRWQLWRWVDGVMLMLVATTLPSILYFLMLWGGNSQQFKAPDWGYDLARMGMWLFGYLGSVVWLELIYRGIRARREDRMRRTVRYDVEGTEKGVQADG